MWNKFQNNAEKIVFIYSIFSRCLFLLNLFKEKKLNVQNKCCWIRVKWAWRKTQHVYKKIKTVVETWCCCLHWLYDKRERWLIKYIVNSKIVRQEWKQRSLRKSRELFLTWIYYEKIMGWSFGFKRFLRSFKKNNS